MKYAVIRLQGQQFKVTEGQEFLVNKLAKDEKPEAEVLMVSDGEKVSLGAPILEKAKITLKVITEEEKGEKIHVFKYKSKSRYRKKIGSRPQFTRLSVSKLDY